MTPLLPPAARFSRLPFPALAAIVCLLFAAAGIAVLDDYGVGADESWQRSIAIDNADYVMGDGDALPTDHNRFYGLAFEMPLLMAERALGLQNSRDIFLMRHLLTHLFYIVGGFFCALLVYRIFGSRWIALLAMLMFLLHPRLYAHSFFNSKDLPFTVMFMIALYLTHRAFRRDTVGAFALLGIVIGLAVNLRPFALLLPAAVLAMRGLDWQFTSNPLRRKRLLVTGGVFAGAVILTIYASQPYYWLNPLGYIDSLSALSEHPNRTLNLFMGETILSDAVPPEYISVWFGITAPPAMLLLGCVGAAATIVWILRRPGRALIDGRPRFIFLCLGCFALPVIAAAVWQFNIYNGWRQMYFLWAPFCLLAATGLHYLAGNAGRRRGRARASYLKTARRAGVYVLAGAALAGALTGIASLHPHQYTYFNSLAGWGANESIGERFEMDYWGPSYRQGLEHLLEKYPQSPLYIYASDDRGLLYDIIHNSQILNDDDRKWLFFVAAEGDFYMANDRIINRYLDSLFPGAGDDGKLPGPVVHNIKAYNSPFLTITMPGLSDTNLSTLSDVYRAKYRDITADGLTVDALFDVYISGDGGTLSHVKTNCTMEDTSARFYLHIFPKDERDLPANRDEYGFDNQNFAFDQQGGRVDDKCWTTAPLPDYPIALIRTGQVGPEDQSLWQAEINPDTQAQFQEIEARLPGLPPITAGPFRLYREARQLYYSRESCNAADTHARFFLHLFPADNNDLPESRSEQGFDNQDFNFSEHGAHRNGKCLAAVPLPDYQIARIRTGQYVAGEGQIWAVDLPGGG